MILSSNFLLDCSISSSNPPVRLLVARIACDSCARPPPDDSWRVTKTSNDARFWPTASKQNTTFLPFVFGGSFLLRRALRVSRTPARLCTVLYFVRVPSPMNDLSFGHPTLSRQNDWCGCQIQLACISLLQNVDVTQMDQGGSALIIVPFDTVGKEEVKNEGGWVQDPTLGEIQELRMIEKEEKGKAPMVEKVPTALTPPPQAPADSTIKPRTCKKGVHASYCVPQTSRLSTKVVIPQPLRAKSILDGLLELKGDSLKAFEKGQDHMAIMKEYLQAHSEFKWMDLKAESFGGSLNSSWHAYWELEVHLHFHLAAHNDQIELPIDDDNPEFPWLARWYCSKLAVTTLWIAMIIGCSNVGCNTQHSVIPTHGQNTTKPRLLKDNSLDCN
eukprot:Gb_13208 [translate_table: standard]